jgi:hypothetical protein
MNLTKKYVEKKYNCQLHKDTGFDDSRKFWAAFENESETEEKKFTHADGWTLAELVENIKEQLKSDVK